MAITINSKKIESISVTCYYSDFEVTIDSDGDLLLEGEDNFLVVKMPDIKAFVAALVEMTA